MSKEFHIEIAETLTMVVTIEAKDHDEALQKIEQEWKDGDYVLGGDEFAGVEFNSVRMTA